MNTVFVAVDEDGTEAAAATGGSAGITSVPLCLKILSYEWLS
jgi:serine protease inhibitor